jgi:hypothetical protein
LTNTLLATVSLSNPKFDAFTSLTNLVSTKIKCHLFNPTSHNQAKNSHSKHYGSAHLFSSSQWRCVTQWRFLIKAQKCNDAYDLIFPFAIKENLLITDCLNARANLLVDWYNLSFHQSPSSLCSRSSLFSVYLKWTPYWGQYFKGFCSRNLF